MPKFSLLIPVFLIEIMLTDICSAEIMDSEEPNFSLNEQDFLRQLEFDENAKSEMLERIKLMDINMDNAISSTEIAEATKGLYQVDFLNEEEKKEYALNIEKFFKQSDTDADNMLRGDEIKEFCKLMQVFTVSQQFRKMDRNGDGFFDEADFPSIEESLAMMEENIKKLHDVSEKLNTIDENEYAQNFIQNMNSAIAKEDYLQMDKNSDGCVTKDEYADYNLLAQEQENNEQEKTYNFTREDLLYLYDQEKKAKPDCLTIEEYTANMSEVFREDFEQNYE